MAGPLANARHEIFAQQLVGGKSEADAYVAAGFKPDPGNPSRLAKRPDVQARIAELKAAAAERAEITVARVLAELGKIGFANMADYMSTGPDGDPFLDFSALTRDQAAALAEVTVEDFKDGRGEFARDVRRVKFKLSDKRSALVDIGKHLGMFTERVEHTGANGGPIETVELSDTEAVGRMLFLIAKARKEKAASPTLN
jgi:phage terminase small subunit